MDYQVIWSDAAIADLHDICTHIAHHNPDAARRMGQGILDHVRILVTFPFIGPTYPRSTRGPLREIIFRPIASSMMSQKSQAVWRCFTSGTERAKNQNFDWLLGSAFQHIPQAF